MKRLLFIGLCAWLISMGRAAADNTLSVADITIPKGGQAEMVITCSFDVEFVGGQLDIELPDNGLVTPTMDGTKPVFSLGFTGTDHSLANSTVSANKYRTVCASLTNAAMPTSGALMSMTLNVSADATVGDSYEAHLTGIEFGTHNSTKYNPVDVTFHITVGEPLVQVALSENDDAAPAASTGAVDVTMTRNIKAGEWSTICLPFDMTAAQVKEAFGSDVQLADFTGWSYEMVGDDVTSISIQFTSVNAIAKHRPYVIKVEHNITSFKVCNVVIYTTTKNIQKAVLDNDGDYTGKLIGKYKTGTVPENNLFLSGNKFWYSTGATPIKAYRATFNFDEIVLSEASNAASRISMSYDDETTSVKESKSSRIEGLKSCYNLKGQRVEKPVKKGVYIRDGKKVVIK